MISQPISAEEEELKLRYSTIRPSTAVNKEQETVNTVRPVLQQQEQIKTAPDITPIGDRFKADISAVKTQEPIKSAERIKLNQKQIIELKNRLSVIERESKSIQRQVVSRQEQLQQKQQQLITIREPRIKDQLKLDINRINTDLIQLKNQLNNLEGERSTIMKKITTSDAGFEEDQEHLGGQDGPKRWPTDGRRSSCFIATAAYGSPLAREVLVLKRFRDDYLIQSAWGRTVIEYYYQHSPPIAEYISKSEFLRYLTRALIWPLVLLIKYPLVVSTVLMLLGLIFTSYKIKHRRSQART